MKIIGAIVVLIVGLNLLAIIVNLLFSNPITAVIIMLIIATTPIIIGYNLIKGNK